MKRLLLFFSFVLCLSATFAQSELLINTGTPKTADHHSGPIYRSSASSGYYYSQYAYVYRSSELSAMNGATLSKIAWNKTNNGASSSTGRFRIYLKNSSVTQYTTGATFSSLISGATLVYDNQSQTIPAAIGFLEFVFSQNFVYTGESLEVLVDWSAPSFSSTAAFNWEKTEVAASIQGYANSAAITTALSTTSNSIGDITNSRPVIKFFYTPAPACSGTPSAGTLSLPSGSAVCAGGSIAINHSGGTAASGLSYQMLYSSSASGPWSAVGASSSAKFSSITPAASGYYRVLVSCGTDSDTTNAVNITINPALAANTYTVGGAGANFATLSDAINAAKCGITGPVTFKMTPGTYTEQVTIPQLSGLNASTRLTIDGSGATLKFKGTSALTYTLGLNGADYITVKNLTIEGTNPDTGRVVHLWNDASNNIFDSVTIKASLTATTSQSVGFCVNNSLTSATTGGTGNNNKLLNSKVTGGYYGVNFYGATGTTGVQTGNEVSNTLVQDFYNYGIYGYYNTDLIVKKNIVERPTRSVVSDFYGIYLSTGCINGLVESNKVRNSFGGAPGNTGGVYAIYVSSTSAATGTENKVFNNAIYDMNGNGTEGGLYFSSGTNIKAYHNTIVFDNTAATTSSTTYGIYSSGTTNVDFKNNLVSITKGGTGTKYAIYFSSSTAGTRTSDYNILHMAATGGTANHVGYNGTARTSLNDWQTATSQDANSWDTDPMMIGYTPTNSAVDNMGTAAAGLTTDIDGNARSASTPDIGALEFTVASCSGTPTAGTITVDSSVCPGKPLALQSTGATIGDGITYQWESTPTGTSAWTPIAGANTPNYTLTSGITEVTDFRLKVSCSYSGLNMNSAVKTVQLNNPMDCYCIPYSGSSTSTDVIAKFELDTLVNVTNGTHVNGYSDFTSKVVGLHQGMPYTAKVTGHTGSGAHGVAIWIDYNNDGNFDVSERLGYASSIQPNGTASIAFTVDPASTLGHHRMRVMYQFNKAGDAIDPCVGVLNGETEDYTVDIKAPPTCAPPTNVSADSPSENTVDVSWDAPTVGSTQNYQLYYSQSATNPTAGTTPSFTGIAASPFQVTGLSPNMKYYVWMRTFCGGTDYSEWSAKDSFRTACNAANVPYVQDFETAVVPGMPDCTSSENAGAGNPWITSSNPGSGFTTKVLRYTYHSTQTANAWFYTQGLNLTAGTSYRLKFDYGTNSTTYTEKLKVSYGNFANHSAMVNDIIDLPSIKGNTKRDTTIDFVAVSSGVYYIGFNVYSASDQNALFVDNIMVSVTPTCDVPTGIVVGGVTSSTADIAWNAPVVGSPMSYDIYYNITGTAPTASTTPSKTNVGASPDQITGLTANTKYYIWMRSFCGGADYSAWTVKDSFTTKCNAATIPFTEGFEGSTNVPACWSQQFVSGSIAFKFGNSTNAAGTTVNPDAYAGTNRLFFNSYSNSGSKTRLVSPAINLTGVNTGIDVSFYWYFSTQGGATSYLTEGVQVQYSLDGVNWTDEGPLVRRYDAVAGWRKQTATIAGAVGQPVVYVGFLFTSNAGYPSYMDSIHIYASPTCLPPTNIMATASTTSTADIQWTPPATGTPVSYDVYYSKTNTPPTAATNPQQTGVSATSTTLTGLDASSLYYVWVRTFCGGTDRSEWSSALKFNTACDVLNTPWSEGFENVPADGDGALPLCWSKENIAGSATGFGVSNTSDAYRGPRTGAYALYTRYSSTNWIYTPGFNLSQDSIYEFSFYMMNKNGTAGFTMDVAYGTDTTAAAMTNSLLAGYAANNTGYTKFNYVIQPTATGVYHFGIKSTAPNSTPWYLNFDDFSLITTGSLPVTISSFKAENAGSVNNILWTTATEQNNAGFEVERSADGNKFEKMAFVASKAEGGNSASTLHYSLTDNKPFVLGTYYRLKQLDKDGKSTYSNVVFVKSGSPVRMEIVNLYPNPAKSQITLLMTAPATNKVQVVVSDLSGRVVMSENRSIEAGENKIMLNVNNLPSGTYMLKAVCADGCESAVKKFVKE